MSESKPIRKTRPDQQMVYRGLVGRKPMFHIEAPVFTVPGATIRGLRPCDIHAMYSRVNQIREARLALEERTFRKAI